jgi:hypothetical protein
MEGIRCDVITDPADALDAVQDVLETRRATATEADWHTLTAGWPEVFWRPETTLMVAREPSGRPRAVTAAVIDEALCLIQMAVASSHEARWALHNDLVRTLIGRRVRYLLVDGEGPFGAIGFDPDVQYYQRLLGYELRHIVLFPRRTRHFHTQKMR